MQILFGETVRRLRREKGLTQEQLAARLNVSFQTISKWERDESYPDITMLPVLAGFFGVRTDDLLGMDEAENERKIQEILDSLADGQNWQESLAALREGLKEFPGEYRLWGEYFSRLTAIGWHDPGEGDRMRARLPEIKTVYQNIMENCTNDDIRLEAKSCLCLYYGILVNKEPEKSAAELEELKRIVGELPSLWKSKEFVRTFPEVLPRSSEEIRKDCHEAIVELLRVFHGMATHLCNTKDNGERRPVHRAMIDVFNTIFPDGDYGLLSSNVFGAWETFAQSAAYAGDYDEAFAAIEQCVEIARRFDELPQTSVHTSPMLQGYVFDKSSSRFLGLDLVRIYLGCKKHPHAYVYPWPEEFKADPRFGALISRVS